MFTIKVLGDFCGAHNLREYEGKCENLHGHNWKVELEIASQTLDKTGMVIDFKIAKKELNIILEELDHKHLNDLEYFKINNPTSENMAKYIYDKVCEKIDKVKSVSVWETDTSCARYNK